MTGLYAKYCGCGYKVATDSRAVEGGEMFFALRGENFDGNAYAQSALEKGARWAVVSSDADLPRDDRFIRVDNPLETLRDLAVWHRNHVLEGKRLPVIGLTGTNGKTTTKELISAVLARKYRVVATQGNLNNDIGVPLSILKITPGTQIAVIEMGANHPDDIARLVKVCQPDYGLITNVGRGHLLGFGSLDGVKAAKGELYKWLSSRDGSVVFLNNDDAILREMARDWVNGHVWPYGLKYQGASVLPVNASNPFLRLKLRTGRVVRTNLVGSYNSANVLAALAIGEYFGVSVEDAVQAVGSYEPRNNRSQLVRTSRNTVIVDAYNANPSSMKAALENLAAMDAENKLALLGDMRELGAESLAEHVKVLNQLREYGIEACLVGEEFSGALKSLGLPPDNWYATSALLCGRLESLPLSGRTILLKGSHSIGMETVLEFL